jgi:hypothetical protein
MGFFNRLKNYFLIRPFKGLSFVNTPIWMSSDTKNFRTLRSRANGAYFRGTS